MANSRQERLATLSKRTRVGRSAAVNHFMAAAEQRERRGLASFLPQNTRPWVVNYLKFVFTRRHRFVDYTKSKKNGRYSAAPQDGKDAIRVALAGDWGTGTAEAESIAELMNAASADFTIHLGDVYYVGDEPEIRENCLGEDTDQFEGVEWPHGTRGSFALNGNHEMYANGGPYFELFLKTLGIPGDVEGQLASFFCLDMSNWRIVGLDTGYNSVGWPILSLIPGLNSIPTIGGDSHLESALLEWLRTVIDPEREPKATVLLSHHQYFSAFERSYVKPAQQLRKIFADQELVWLWGHEHRLGIYDRFSKDGGVTVYGRCIGHGGMPIEMKVPDRTKAPLVLYDPRTHTLPDGTAVGENGYALASFEGPALTLEYRDTANNVLLVERFEPAAGGKLSHTLVDSGNILKPPPN
jgi:hypothetical protein